VKDQASNQIQGKGGKTTDHGKVHRSLLSVVITRIKWRAAEVWHRHNLTINNHSHFLPVSAP
ncbi:hypothetical protein, partial [Alcanivorax sp. HI0003]|uniref:hypothetical protein n=1 Tax=Alcanivorax sp. HI0003 TaxID=1822217 RepID=UPI001E28B51B